MSEVPLQIRAGDASNGETGRGGGTHGHSKFNQKSIVKRCCQLLAINTHKPAHMAPRPRMRTGVRYPCMHAGRWKEADAGISPKGPKGDNRKVDMRLHGKGYSSSHGARPVHQIITMIKWIRTSRLSIKKSLAPPLVPAAGGQRARPLQIGPQTLHIK